MPGLWWTVALLRDNPKEELSPDNVQLHVRSHSQIPKTIKAVTMPDENNLNSWTTDTLHQHIKAMMDERDKRYEQLASAQKEAVASALASSERAVEKAEAIAERWRANANEWRAAMSDKDKLYLTKEVARGYFVTGLMAAGVLVGIVETFIRVLFPHAR